MTEDLIHALWINKHPLSLTDAPKRIFLVFHTALFWRKFRKISSALFFACAISYVFVPTIILSHELRRRCKQCVLAKSSNAHKQRTERFKKRLQRCGHIFHIMWQRTTPPQISEVGHVFSCLKLISEMNPRLYKLVLILSVMAKSQGTMMY